MAAVAHQNRPTPERESHGKVTHGVMAVEGNVQQMVWRAGGKDWLLAQYNRSNLTKSQFGAAVDFEVAHAAYHQTEATRSFLDPDVLAMKMINGASTKAATGMSDTQLDARKAYRSIMNKLGDSGVKFLVAVVIDGREPRNAVPAMTGVATKSDDRVGMGMLRYLLNEVEEVLK
ncbi:hypothetical protein [Thalassospira sp.]|uniref:hypothetical protein n=1 Tax=Thalassospira sp. TaxID=1912094 RepID=UPI00257CE078|nr:hypothetical protein [Thalassospira sp.]|tara:strand:- start:502 stop:1023 length:522 start_codon:yes stop_codon:yes gene_type:complete